MAVCMLLELALGEDISNAEEGRTANCHQKQSTVTRRCRQGSWRPSSVRRGRGRWWLIDLDSQEMAECREGGVSE